MKALYMDNMELKEWITTVSAIDGTRIMLEETAFYPESGGVSSDKGIIICDEKSLEYSMSQAIKEGNKILHDIGSHDLVIGDKVRCVLDWDRRHRLMRMHTAAHLLSALFSGMGARITGNRIDYDKSRMDYSIESFDRALIEEKVMEANNLIKRGAQVKVSYMNREEALEIPGMVKLAGALPPTQDTLRIVSIVGIDMQADGGCHVNNISHIGKIVITKMENKGSKNRRITYVLED
ncbi:MAG: alanine--tRNA ligase-related protein [Candidatus Woesearchaeota archaeon]